MGVPWDLRVTDGLVWTHRIGSHSLLLVNFNAGNRVNPLLLPVTQSHPYQTSLFLHQTPLLMCTTRSVSGKHVVDAYVACGFRVVRPASSQTVNCDLLPEDPACVCRDTYMRVE